MVQKENGLDQTLKLLKTGYEFIPERQKGLEKDLVFTKVLGEQTVIMSGETAAELFCDERYFTRKTAWPARVEKNLFGQKSVQTLDGDVHRNRKAMFMSFMSLPRLGVLSELTAEQWRAAVREQNEQGQFVLFDEAEKVMLRVACRWAGVPIKEEHVAERSRQLGELVDSLTAAGPRYVKARIGRKKLESWAQALIRQEREGLLKASKESPLAVIARHRELDGVPLSEETAANELLNMLWPVVALARLIVFGAMAMLANPETRRRLSEEGEPYARLFTQEVRRFYPFAPFTLARIKRSFVWRGARFEKGMLALLDIYGMNHDARRWQAPHLFYPERFRDWTGTPFGFIPQGAGDHYLGHRCAGEWMTLAILSASFLFLSNEVSYKVPRQNLHMQMNRIPTLPESRFIITHVQLLR